MKNNHHDNDVHTIIVGAGIAGLSFGYHTQLPFQIIEQEPHVGGICKSVDLAGCTFDYGPRILLPGSQYTFDLCQSLLDDNLHFSIFNDWLYHHRYNLYTKYPIQKHLYGLPADEVMKCLTGLVETATDFDSQTHRTFSNYREWLYQKVGQYMADTVVIPQELKKWQTDPATMDYRWASRKVARPDLETALRGATHSIPYDRQFGYPLSGGIATLIEAFAAQVRHRLRLGVAVESLDTHNHIVRLSDGSVLSYRSLVSSIPLPLLVSLLEHAPSHISERAKTLQHISLHCVCMVVERERISNKNFVYVYDPSLIFQRISFFSNLSPHMAPPGYSSLVAEVSYKGTPLEDKGTLIQQVQTDLITMNVLKSTDTIVTTHVLDLPYAYPRMHIGWQESVRTIRDYLETQDIYLFGRFGEWEYLNIHDIIPQSRDLAIRLKERYA